MQHSVISVCSNQKQQQQENSELTVKGVYGLVRHPMYTGLLISLWSKPTMVRGIVIYSLIPRPIQICDCSRTCKKFTDILQ